MKLFVEKLFLDLHALFAKNGYELYMVGGTSRDYLLNKEVTDFDFATNATPTQMEVFLPLANYRFAKFGTVRLKMEGNDVEITTLRVEGEYSDARHPSFIKYVDDIKLDYVRRDISINAIYIDSNFKVHDFCHGVSDLNNKVIRIIGDPTQRLKEDPLRIVRIIRFMTTLNFNLDKNCILPLDNESCLLDKLNVDKIRAEFNKVVKSFRVVFLNNISNYVTKSSAVDLLVAEFKQKMGLN